MDAIERLRCRHAFEAPCIHANGDVVCSIIDGRGDFVLGSVHQQSLDAIFDGERARELRRLVLMTADSYCSAIGKHCPLKSTPVTSGEEPAPRIRALAIEPTTACSLRCIACLVRDFTGDVTWRHAQRDGGPSFLLWDTLRRSKQHLATGLLRAFPRLREAARGRVGRRAALLLRERIPKSRPGTLPVDVIQRVVSQAGPAVERVDFFGYGEPLLHPDLVEALRHTREALPMAEIVISTNGLCLREPVEEAIVRERLVDWLVFSIDGCDASSYRRYRIGGDFDRALCNLARAHRRGAPAGVRVIWQYVVFRWNDRDDQLKLAIAKADALGIPIWFDFSRTFGRSRRTADGLQFLTPYLRPGIRLPERSGA